MGSNPRKSPLKAPLKWSPALPIRRADNIISSKAREKGLLGFKPSYEVKGEPVCMGFLMSNEYMRMWFKQRAEFEKDTYTREEIIKSESKIHRRFVQRMMTYRNPGKNEIIEQRIRKCSCPVERKEFQYQRMKYKPECTVMLTHKGLKT
ncbi:uncharacterized protein LOC114325744 [Diabrotica virgifera virgifera]|uniref:Uncharacterized protein LOC114325744 n=1 Tax=Diabrotica virgifera virgifera TaxID=50390 RepID=A0A6P7F7L6_DIAVI|nr:uncharacterized protein LOC114325744 [Diabrotica virgifera virgifera]